MVVAGQKLHVMRLCDADVAELGVPVDREECQRELLQLVEAHNMLPLYEKLCGEFPSLLTRDSALVARMEEENAAKLSQLEDTIRDAEENLGESEIREGYLAKAVFYYETGDLENAMDAFEETEKKTVAVGHKLDLVFYQLRLNMFYEDFKTTGKLIEKARHLIENGGDWEKRNRLKAYEGLYKLVQRDIAGAAQLFLSSLQTFTSFELMDMKSFVFYAAITGLFSLQRVELKKQVIDSPEVNAFVEKIPFFQSFVRDLHACKYDSFVESLVGVADLMRLDRYLHTHWQFYVRELRIKAYNQFLESYRTVHLDTMSVAFNISLELLDRELSKFIASGRLFCKIDKVHGIIETQHLSTKNHLYQQVLKHGDVLLARVAKLSRVIDM